MKGLLRIAACAAAAGIAHAQQPPPLPAAGTNTPSAADAPKLREEVNLSDSPVVDVFDIQPPADSQNPEKAPEVTGPLPGDEKSVARPEVTGTVDLTAKDNGKTIRAQVGNLVRISLESNPTTGYSWELRGFEFGVAEYVSGDLVARTPEGGNVLFGAPGDAVITLQAVKPGNQRIELVYRRIWEPPDQIAATFSFDLEVPGPAASPAADSAPTPAPAP